VSKVYFYIGYYDEAVTFALLAGLLFEDEPAGEYKETIIGTCLTVRMRLHGQLPKEAEADIISWLS
jgi:hypothetical protein